MGRLAPIAARTTTVATASSDEARNDGPALDYAESRLVSLAGLLPLMKQKAKLASKTIINLYALNTALRCFLAGNLI